jgi:hypothetical protein
VTQASANRVHEIVAMAEATDSVISFAVLMVKGIGISHAVIERLRSCSEAVRSKVNFHFVFAEADRLYEDHSIDYPSRTYRELVRLANSTFDSFTCEEVLSKGFDCIDPPRLKRPASFIRHPVNMLRNVAVDHVKIKHLMVLDAEKRPSQNIGASCVTRHYGYS